MLVPSGRPPATSVPQNPFGESTTMGITLTEKAASEVKRIMADQKLESETVLRVGVTGGGCSGFSYALGFDKTYDAKVDSRFEYHGVPGVVDKKSARDL